MAYGKLNMDLPIETKEPMELKGELGSRQLSATEYAEVVLGERWTLRILHELMRGTHRFHDIQTQVGAAPNMVSARLRALKSAGLVDRQRYSNKPARYEYHLTRMGTDLKPVIMAIETWAGRWRDVLVAQHKALVPRQPLDQQEPGA